MHPSAASSGPRRLKAFQHATGDGYLITGHDAPAFQARVPSRVHPNDRHLVAAALVLRHGLNEEDDPVRHKVMIVSDNTRHLAMSETRQLGIDVSKAGAFLDRLYQHAPARTRQALAKSLVDLKNPPYSRAELVAALRLHGAMACANGLEATTL